MGFLRGWTEESSFGRWFIEFRQSRRLVLLIVAIALLLDNMLLTTVVPIIPNYLFNIRHRKDNLTIPNDGVSAVNCTPGGPCSDIVISPTPYTFCNTTTNWDVEPRTQTTYSQKSRRDELEDENLEVSILFASKAIMQLIANPFVGPLTHK
ncbi:hypothetical protein QYM36_011176 [Artemia franciscana]|uniref:Uncharacterized protein n=2 Tax=Artemia franciscana TaxID=6661 RepID=A0AA88HJE1_ARTSF|nr:hypothetical protein QYM36_011176 [Artemia franciscana]